jgi:hypothetical protein
MSTSLIYSNNSSIETFQWKKEETQNKNSWKMKKSFFLSFGFYLSIRPFFLPKKRHLQFCRKDLSPAPFFLSSTQIIIRVPQVQF